MIAIQSKKSDVAIITEVSVFEISELSQIIVQELGLSDLINLYLTNSIFRFLLNRTKFLQFLSERHNAHWSVNRFLGFVSLYKLRYSTTQVNWQDRDCGLDKLHRILTLSVNVGDRFTMLEVEEILLQKKSAISYSNLVNLASINNRLDLIEILLKRIENKIHRSYVLNRSIVSAIKLGYLELAQWLNLQGAKVGSNIYLLLLFNLNSDENLPLIQWIFQNNILEYSSEFINNYVETTRIMDSHQISNWLQEFIQSKQFNPIN